MAKHTDSRCPAVRLADEMNRKAKEVADEAKRLDSKHKFNLKAMRKVAAKLKEISANPDNIIQGPDLADLDWCINVLNNPEV